MKMALVCQEKMTTRYGGTDRHHRDGVRENSERTFRVTSNTIYTALAMTAGHLLGSFDKAGNLFFNP